MGYSYSFIDNQTYGTEDINKAFSRLTTKGITPYPTDENLINAMNTITSEITESGIDFDSYHCRVSIVGDTINISSGTAFFENGVSMVIDEDGATLPYQPEVYVYLYHDINLNSCYPTSSETLPESNYVPLAYIDNTGNIKDIRIFAKSKLLTNSQVVPFQTKIDVDFDTFHTGVEVLNTINVGYNNFSYLVFHDKARTLCNILELKENDYSDYSDFERYSYIRFMKRAQEVDVFVKSNGHYSTVEGLEIYIF